MALFSMRTRFKLSNYGLAAAMSFCAILIQTTLLSRIPVHDPVPVYCNLPLTMVIICGVVFGSSMPSITPDQLRLSSVSHIFAKQAASGSVAGLLIGALTAAIYAPMLPVFPAYLPVAGWVAGYFCLRSINRQN